MVTLSFIEHGPKIHIKGPLTPFSLMDLANSGYLPTMPKGDRFTQLISETSTGRRQNRAFSFAFREIDGRSHRGKNAFLLL